MPDQPTPLAGLAQILRCIPPLTIETLFVAIGVDSMRRMPSIWADPPLASVLIAGINHRVRDLPTFRVKIGCLDTRVDPGRRAHAPFTQAVRAVFRPLVDSGTVSVRSRAGNSVDDIGIW
jgi:hypothetical protein